MSVPSPLVIGEATLYRGHCIEVLRLMPDASVDSIVTDPPYELKFMGKSWDATGIAYSVEMWTEAMRVLKPGGHLLAFGGSRTYHRMACAIEDAGFEIRDQIMYVYGSGFPKSLDVSKAIDKAAGREREVISIDERSAVRPVVADQSGRKAYRLNGDASITAPATDAARQWEGWGTALKPAHEPICVARKPLVGTVAANVLAWGTGAMNIDACRVEGEPVVLGMNRSLPGGAFVGVGAGRGSTEQRTNSDGRWPANVIHDGSDEVLDAFPAAPGALADAKVDAGERKTKGVFGSMKRGREASANTENTGAVGFKMKPGARRADIGSAARFFYCAKASRADRNSGCESLPQKVGGMVSNTSGQHITRRDEGYEAQPVGNHHPTVKPTALMRYLCRLVTQPGGTVLDLFMGSGSTGKACTLEGFRFIGIDLDADAKGEPLGYTEIAAARIAHAQSVVAAGRVQQIPLFDHLQEPA